MKNTPTLKSLKYALALALFFVCSTVRAQISSMPFQMDGPMLKDSLIAVFNYPLKPNSPEGYEGQLYTRFPWLKAIDKHPRYHLSLYVAYEDLLAGYAYLKSIQLSSVNTVNGNPIGDYAPIDLVFENFKTGDAYTLSEFHTKNGYRKISAVELSYYTRNYFLPDNYDKAGIIFQLLSTDVKEYRSIKRPDGRKFDKEEGDVITGYIIQKMIEEDFEEDNNLNFSKRDWEYLDLQKRNHFAHFFYTQNLDYFKKNQINAELLIPIIANSYLKKGKDYPNLEAAVKDYKLRMDAPITYDLLQKEYKLLGLYGIDEANNCYLSSLVFPCLEGNCNFGEGTVDMGKTSFSGSFINGFASSGVITEKNSGIKIKVDFDPTTKLLKSGEYISDPRLKASFTRKLDGIYFDVDTKSFSYQGTTMGLSGRSGILTGKHTIKKEDFYEIYNYNKGEVDLLSATLREASVGEFEYTGAYKMLEGNLIPFGKGRISFPYYSKESAAIEVKGNLFDAIQTSPEAMKILFSIFEKNKEINTPYLKLWHEQYLSIQDANRYAIIQELSNEDLLKFVYKENESKLKNLKIAHGSLSDLINRDWRDAYSPKSILLISKKDGVSNFCLRSQNGSSASVKYNFDNKCVAFEKRGDVQEISLKVLTSAPYQIDLVCDGCNPDNYFAIFY